MVDWRYIQERTAEILTTPTAWFTMIGSMFAGLGHLTTGGLILAIVGVGGIAMSMGFTVMRQGDQWGWPWVVEGVLKIIQGKDKIGLFGMVGHLPQAIAGLTLLVIT